MVMRRPVISTIFIVAIHILVIDGRPETESRTAADVAGPSQVISVNGEPTYPEWVDDWVAPLEIQKWFPYYLAGHDENGCPLYILEYGKWNFVEALARGEGGPANVKELIWTYLQQFVYRTSRDGNANGTQGLGFIVDWDGFSLTNYADPNAIDLALRQFTAVNDIYQVLNYAIFINTNFASESFIRMAKPFIGSLLEKCEIFGTQKTKWMPYILKKIRRSQLPQGYGGSEDWKPVLMGGMPIPHLAPKPPRGHSGP